MEALEEVAVMVVWGVGGRSKRQADVRNRKGERGEQEVDSAGEVRASKRPAKCLA